MEKTDVTVIVPTHQCAKTLPTLLAHLELQSHPSARLEIIIVDIGSTDGTSEVAQRYSDGAPIRTQSVPFGPSEAGAALTAAVAAAHGRWLVFLHQDLLAGTHLIRSHVRAQERHGGDVVIRGRIDRHPQAGESPNIQPYLFLNQAEPAAEAPLPFVDWRMWNLSMTKRACEAVGAFASAFPYTSYADVHLAWRMHANGVKAFYHPDATAYAWYVPDLAEERRRAYCRGYGLQVLLAQVDDPEVRRRFALEAGALPMLFHRLSDPAWAALAGIMPGNRGARAFAARHLVRHEMLRGYHSAAMGTSPHIPGTDED